MSIELPKLPELPVPGGHIYDAMQDARFDFYTADQLRAYAQEASRLALEDAAKVCHDKYMERAKFEGFSREATTARALELAIRALGDKP